MPCVEFLFMNASSELAAKVYAFVSFLFSSIFMGLVVSGHVSVPGI